MTAAEYILRSAVRNKMMWFRYYNIKQNTAAGSVKRGFGNRVISKIIIMES